MGCYDGFEGEAEDAELELELDVDMEKVEIEGVSITEAGLEFEAGTESVVLTLSLNTGLLATDAVVLRDGETLTPSEAGLELPYWGQVVGDPDSWVRLRLRGDEFEGLIYRDHELWEVRKGVRGGLWMASAAIDDYLDAPTNSHHTCATGEAQSAHASYMDLSAAAFSKADCMKISIALVSDYSHVAALGGSSASESEMLARINEADGIFRDDLNYGFSVEAIESHSSQGGFAFNVASAGNTPLDPFSDYKQSHFPELGLAHLFVARTSFGTVGLAWIGATCSARFGSGVSNYLGTGKSSTIVATHEIGHNFGANHDSGGSPYVMAPSVNASATEFSDASGAQIDSHVASVSCFEPCADSNPGPDPSGCEDVCGGQSGEGCWCDSQCAQFEDCCENYEAICLEPEEPSCTGACGGESPDGCWCDSNCTQFGDCCEDYDEVCE